MQVLQAKSQVSPSWALICGRIGLPEAVGLMFRVLPGRGLGHTQSWRSPTFFPKCRICLQSRNGVSCPSDPSNTSEGPYLLLARENTLLKVSPEWVRSIQIIFVS